MYLSSLFCSLDLSVTRLSAAAEEKRAKDLADDLKVLNEVARTRRNDLVEVTEWAKADLAQAQLTRQGADRDLVQAMETINTQKTQIEATLKENSELCAGIQHVVNHVRLPEDMGKTWVEFFPSLLRYFDNYVRMV
jgi:hypothetical protein